MHAEESIAEIFAPLLTRKIIGRDEVIPILTEETNIPELMVTLIFAIDAAVHDEREACAKLAESKTETVMRGNGPLTPWPSKELVDKRGIIAAAIRARGE